MDKKNKRYIMYFIATIMFAGFAFVKEDITWLSEGNQENVWNAIRAFYLISFVLYVKNEW